VLFYIPAVPALCPLMHNRAQHMILKKSNWTRHIFSFIEIVCPKSKEQSRLIWGSQKFNFFIGKIVADITPSSMKQRPRSAWEVCEVVALQPKHSNSETSSMKERCFTVYIPYRHCLCAAGRFSLTISCQLLETDSGEVWRSTLQRKLFHICFYPQMVTEATNNCLLSVLLKWLICFRSRILGNRHKAIGNWRENKQLFYLKMFSAACDPVDFYNILTSVITFLISVCV